MAALNNAQQLTVNRHYLAASSDNDLEAMQEALARGAEIDAVQLPSQATALHHAVRHENMEMLAFLVEAGANMEMGNTHGYTPLYVAAQLGMQEAFDFLLASGADPNAQSKNGSVPLHAAINNYRVDCVKSLLDAGAKRDHKKRGKNTADSPEDFVEGKLVGVGGRGQPQLWAGEMAEIFKYYAELEKEPMPDYFRREPLFTEKPGKPALFDQPRVWRKFDEVVASVQDECERRLSKKDFMQVRERGTSWLERGVECQAFGSVMNYLHSRNEVLIPEDLLDDEGKPNSLLLTIVRKRALGTLASKENWHSQGMVALKKVMRALPEEARGQVTNLHGLYASLGRTEQSAGWQR